LPKDGKVLSHLGFNSKVIPMLEGPSNFFDLSPKWDRTLPSFGNFHGIFIGCPLKIKISKLIFDTLLWT
jgi:hypothetical protein